MWTGSQWALGVINRRELAVHTEGKVMLKKHVGVVKRGDSRRVWQRRKDFNSLGL